MDIPEIILQAVKHRLGECDCDEHKDRNITASLPDQIQALNSFAEYWAIKPPYAVGDFVVQIKDGKQGWRYRWPKAGAIAKVVAIMEPEYKIGNNEPVSDTNIAVAVFTDDEPSEIKVYTVKSKYFKMYKPE